LGCSVASAGDVNGDGYDDLIIVASPVTSGSNSTYVVFGKADGFAASLNVATLDGMNGFRLDGGGSVAPAGDVNADGFDDLIVGALGADFNGPSSGSAYVLYGADFTGSVTRLGGAAADTFTGTAAAERFVGGLGDDTLIGGGGLDVFNGGGGNDRIVVGPGPVQQVDGGAGVDRVNLDDMAAVIDFRAIPNSRIENVETLDFTGGDANAVTLSSIDVFDLASALPRITIDGDANDSLTLIGDWTQTGIAGGYRELTLQAPFAPATLWVDTDIAFTLIA
jgi:hypothetical protein